jgi:hypothetical protein
MPSSRALSGHRCHAIQSTRSAQRGWTGRPDSSPGDASGPARGGRGAVEGLLVLQAVVELPEELVEQLRRPDLRAVHAPQAHETAEPQQYDTAESSPVHSKLVVSFEVPRSPRHATPVPLIRRLGSAPADRNPRHDSGFAHLAPYCPHRDGRCLRGRKVYVDPVAVSR